MEEAKKRLEDLLAVLTGSEMDAVLNDGRDEGDAAINSAFSRAQHSALNAITELARLSVPGLSKDQLDDLWRDAWTANTDQTPEGKINHAINYASALLALINKEV